MDRVSEMTKLWLRQLWFFVQQVEDTMVLALDQICIVTIKKYMVLFPETIISRLCSYDYFIFNFLNIGNMHIKKLDIELL